MAVVCIMLAISLLLPIIAAVFRNDLSDGMKTLLIIWWIVFLFLSLGYVIHHT